MSMSPHPARRDGVSLAEVGDQRLGRGDLARRRWLLVEIAHQADADPVFVDVVSARRCGSEHPASGWSSAGRPRSGRRRCRCRCRSRSGSRSRRIRGSCGARRRSDRSCHWRWHCDAGRCTSRADRPCWDKPAHWRSIHRQTAEAVHPGWRGEPALRSSGRAIRHPRESVFDVEGDRRCVRALESRARTWADRLGRRRRGGAAASSR